MSLLSHSLYASPWENILEPELPPSESIGSYANGCLKGAHALPLEGEGYQVLRPQRARYFAHPTTIAFIQEFAHLTHTKTSRTILVGDLSLPQGGRFASGHTSHQNGLDVDIWLRLPKARWARRQLELPEPMSVVNLDRFELNEERWQTMHFQLVKLAALDSRVARIFVHPTIKDKLCRQTKEESDWLRKIRPWWGHHYHIHVRLACPESDKLCQDQPSPPEGPGCGADLRSWWPTPPPTGAVKADLVKNTNSSKKPRVLPYECQRLLSKIIETVDDF
ncbi:penicillin-insensitive murein endopeptidase [Vibrio agarilyticus]|uniref:penicillin-insensitive murein endopeptidase n=1 Tax=Vibrio agarilyticus TaxID=2726741 RepID=UPI001FECA4C4|nr:penicillin-insensitive murein endopeptidase [Vibrio agarilyticus]